MQCSTPTLAQVQVSRCVHALHVFSATVSLERTACCRKSFLTSRNAFAAIDQQLRCPLCLQAQQDTGGNPDAPPCPALNSIIDVKGRLGQVEIGESFSFYGGWTASDRYGHTFEVRSSVQPAFAVHSSRRYCQCTLPVPHDFRTAYYRLLDEHLLADQDA